MKNSITERIPYDWFEIDAIEGTPTSIQQLK